MIHKSLTEYSVKDNVAKYIDIALRLVHVLHFHRTDRLGISHQGIHEGNNGILIEDRQIGVDQNRISPQMDAMPVSIPVLF